jgi:chromosome segregation ATPase
MAGYENLCDQIDFEPLINSAYDAIILTQAIQESIRAAKAAELKDKKTKLKTNIESYQESLERNQERTARCLKDISATEKRIAEGTATEKTHTNLNKSRENLGLLAARKEDLDAKLANAEENLKKADKRIENLLAKSTLTAAREVQRSHYAFFLQACKHQKGYTLEDTVLANRRF